MSDIKLASPPEAHYTVYKLTSPAGLVYIGFTGKNVKNRWDSGWGYNRGTPIREAINYFGWRSFHKVILCEKLTKKGAEKLEAWFIEYYDSMNPEKGYNRITGGARKGSRANKALREKISQAKIHTCLTNSDYNQWNKEHMIEHYRRHPEHRREIAKQMSDYLLSPEGRKFALSSPKPKPVRCVEIGKIYPSQRAAERETGLCSIHKVCQGKRQVCGGCHWEYI